MQYERAGDTRTLKELYPTQQWDALPEAVRRDLLRKHHASISAELVQLSVRSPEPPIAIHLTPEYEAPYVAALCEAHVLDVDSALYRQLTQPEPRVRMALLSGLLRVADILDESRRRASREKARTLLLDSVAQTHWWRHYEGQVYRSLSAIAKAVTGSHWNGHLFFGLTTHKRDRT